MAKKNNIEETTNVQENNAVPETPPVKKVKKTPAKKVEAPAVAENAQPEEHHGIFATVVAIIALIFIAGSIFAFVMFIKARNYYQSQLNAMKSDLSNSSTPGDLLSGSAPASVEADDVLDTSGGIYSNTAPDYAGSGSDSVGVDDTYSSSDSTGSSSDDVNSDTGSDSETPEPEKVGKYNFDEQISYLDSKANQLNEDLMNSDIISNSEMGY